MRRWSMIFLLCLASCLSRGTGGAKAESEIPPKPGVLDAKSGVDDVLDALQQSGKDVKSFSADVTDTEDDLIQNTEVIRYGKVWFQTQANGDAVLHLPLTDKEVAKKKIQERIEYLLQAGWLSIRNYDMKQETRIQMALPGQKMNLFQLGTGAFPLPIGQDKKDVHSQFDVTIPPPDKDDPKGTIHLLLTPKVNTKLADSFFSIEVWVDFTQRMPVQIMTEDKGKVKLATWNLLNLKLNLTMDKSDLSLPPLEKGWDSIDKPIKQ